MEYGDLSNKIFNTIDTLQIENIKQIRKLVERFIVISGAIIGFTLPIFGRTSLIRNPDILAYGLLFFILVVVYGFFYLKQVLTKENNNLAKQKQLYIEALKFFGDNKNDDLNRKLEDIDKFNRTTQKNEQRYALDLLFYSFLFGLLSIIFSIINL